MTQKRLPRNGLSVRQLAEKLDYQLTPLFVGLPNPEKII